MEAGDSYRFGNIAGPFYKFRSHMHTNHKLGVLNKKDPFHLTQGGNTRHTSPMWACTIIGTTAKIQKYTLHPSFPLSTGGSFARPLLRYGCRKTRRQPLAVSGLENSTVVVELWD